MTLAQVFGILAVSVAFLCIVVAIFAALAAAFGDLDNGTNNQTRRQKEK